jgi:hypothetical protein
MARTTKTTETVSQAEEINEAQVIEVPKFDATSNLDEALNFIKENELEQPKQMAFMGYESGKNYFNIIDDENFITVETWHSKKSGKIGGRLVVITEAGNVPVKEEIARSLAQGITLTVHLEPKEVLPTKNDTWKKFVVMQPTLMSIGSNKSIEPIEQ